MRTEIFNMITYQSDNYPLGDSFIMFYVVKLKNCYCVAIRDHWDHEDILPETLIEDPQEVYDLYIKSYRKYAGV